MTDTAFRSTFRPLSRPRQHPTTTMACVQFAGWKSRNSGLRTFAFGRGEPGRRRARDRAIQCGRSPARNLSAGHGAQLHYVRSEGRPHRLRASGRNLQRHCGSNFMGGISPIREDTARSAHRPYGKDAYRVERLLGTRLVGHCCVRWPQEVRLLALRQVCAECIPAAKQQEGGMRGLSTAE